MPNVGGELVDVVARLLKMAEGCRYVRTDDDRKALHDDLRNLAGTVADLRRRVIAARVDDHPTAAGLFDEPGAL